MKENEHIKSIQKLPNGHFLLVVNEESRAKLSSFLFEKGIENSIEYAMPLYTSKGWLELFNLESLKIFLEINIKMKHISEELSSSILEDAEKLRVDTDVIKFEHPKISFFHPNTNEKKNLFERLQLVKSWADQFLNPSLLENYLSLVFDDIFRVLLPYEKRGIIKTRDCFWNNDIEKDGNILIQPLRDQIGRAYKKFHDFKSICSKLSKWPSLEFLTKSPESLRCSLDLLEDEEILKPLADWLESIIASGRNPIDDTNLSDIDIKQLKDSSNILLRACDGLKLEQEKASLLSLTS